LIENLITLVSFCEKLQPIIPTSQNGKKIITIGTFGITIVQGSNDMIILDLHKRKFD
jgi:hypothetical protein